jgi:hypothetical protein
MTTLIENARIFVNAHLFKANIVVVSKVPPNVPMRSVGA